MTPTPAPDDRQRDFPPLPTARGRRSFAATWWGNAWVEALEGPTCSATGRLARGRTYARGGNVGQITVTPGRATAHVQGSQPRPYRTSMDIPTLTRDAWDVLLDAAAAQAGHIAALLDRDMPTTLADTAAQAGVHLLPRPYELTPRCSCPDWGDPCKHAAALYYQVARLLDHDPFVLLLLRGRGESELMADVHRRNAVHTTTAQPPPGVPARDVFAAARAGLPPLPAPPPPVDHPGPVPELTSASAPAPGLDPAALRFLAADTATRATQMLNQALAPSPGHLQDLTPATLSTEDDLVRLAAAGPSAEIFTRLCWSAHRTPASLTRAARAWQYGGAAAMEILDTAWDPDPSYLRAVREEIKRSWDGERAPAIRITGNWLTVSGHDAQLRLGTGGRLWYPYRKKYATWWPAGFPDRDVTAVLSALLEPRAE
ncbi:SWIM zinc finger family protein [Streptomyces sp. NPDC058525]|uniref:SWIM zinc finger family protein n=1 Tax=Streptomyces sp. NPDC058525 TaxID=3346538 RepID=UPI00364A5D72